MRKGVMLFETQACTGCRSCELACSFHHREIFSPSKASIKITDRPNRLGFAISLYEQREADHLACDNCQGEHERYCVKYCSPLMKAELSVILDKFQVKD
jgi:Fe-S-cluster-containing hydrogenase component 2